MIRFDKGEVEIRGGLSDILSDISTMACAIRDAFMNKSGMDKELAESLVKYAVKLGFSTGDELEAEQKRVDGFFEKEMKKPEPEVALLKKLFGAD